MKACFAMAAVLLVTPVAAAAAAERYDCFHVAGGDSGIYRQNRAETVELTIDGDQVRSRVRIKAANKDLTFTGCSAVKADGSHFSRWFATECRTLASADGTPYTIEAFVAGAYAGISPPVDAGYGMHATLADIGAKIGAGTPERTFVIYADRKPQYEFFCYRRK